MFSRLTACSSKMQQYHISFKFILYFQPESIYTLAYLGIHVFGIIFMKMTYETASALGSERQPLHAVKFLIIDGVV